MNIIIIGNGAAGNSAAETIRKYDDQSKVTLIANDNSPFYSACALPDYLSGWIKRDQVFIKRCKNNNGCTNLFKQNVTFIEPANKTVWLDRENIKYDKLILAAGSRPFLPAIPGNQLPGNFTIKSVMDIDSIIDHKPERVVVVGSGNIGVETADALHIRGCQVTLVELANRILPRILDETPSQLVEHILKKNKIQVFTGEKVLQVNGNNQVESVLTSIRTIDCDTVIWAAGVRQNVEVARTAGIEIGNLGGIKVNSYMETNVSNIYACGDCIESISLLSGQPVLSQLWPSAKRQGEIAALNCLGYPIKYEGSFNIVIEEILGNMVVSIGLTEDDLKNQFIQVLEERNGTIYSKILLLNDIIMGVQAIGIAENWGAVTAMMKNRIPISEISRVTADPILCQKVPWYLPAWKLLSRYY